MATINVSQINEFNTNFNKVKEEMCGRLNEIVNVYKSISANNIMSSAEIDAIIAEINAKIDRINEDFNNISTEFYQKIATSSDFAETEQKRAEDILSSIAG